MLLGKVYGFRDGLEVLTLLRSQTQHGGLHEWKILDVLVESRVIDSIASTSSLYGI